MLKQSQNELVVRKRLAGFVEKLFRYCYDDVRHDLFKSIVYSEAECCTPLEDKFKNYYDAYYFLLSCRANPLTRDVLKRFLYLVNGKEADESLVIRLTTYFFKLSGLPPVHKAVEFHTYVYKELTAEGQPDCLIVSLMFFNYVLVKNGIPALEIYQQYLTRYEQCRDKYLAGDKESLIEFALKLVTENKTQPKSYYANLTPLTAAEVCNRFKQDEQFLRDNYGVTSLMLFGSFAKGAQRIDSDIDMLIQLSFDIAYDKRAELIDELKTYYKAVFNRFIDMVEINEYIENVVLKKMHKNIKIF